MAKGFKHGVGGAVSGGASLNFSVVGGTAEPESPSENMIWVNTEDEITSWVFSVTEPEEPSDGMVWFATGTTCATDFNALKNNSIQVYPVAVSQYNGGAWEIMEAMAYQDGMWLAVDGEKTYIFKDGEFSSGGWDKYVMTVTVAGGITYTGDVSIVDNQLCIKGAGPTTTAMYSTERFVTSGRSKLVFRINKITSTNTAISGVLHVGISDFQHDGSFVAETFVDVYVSNDVQELVVPITPEYYGSYYIKAAIIREVNFEETVYISEIRLE